MTYERETIVDVVLVSIHCSECNGELTYSGMSLASNPMQYVHNCANCSTTENIRGKKYPYSKYVPRVGGSTT